METEAEGGLVAFEYGCFISYVHAKEQLMTEFIEGFVGALKGEIETYLGDAVYVDEDRLKPGYNFEPALASGICGSACWIMVYVPQYSEHDYCLREFGAMRLLEERRRRELGELLKPHQGMIIPVLLRGDPRQLPGGIAQSKQYLDFSKFTTASGDISRNPAYMEKISAVAKYVSEIYELGEGLHQECEKFEIPMLDGDLGFGKDRQPFPGRGGTGGI